MTRPEDDHLLLALRDLGIEDPDPARSRAVLAGATRTIARRRRFAERRIVVMAAVYAAMIAPFAAGALSAGFLAGAIVQAIVVLRYAHGGIF
jgi:hypothetical protein